MVILDFFLVFCFRTDRLGADLPTYAWPGLFLSNVYLNLGILIDILLGDQVVFVWILRLTDLAVTFFGDIRQMPLLDETARGHFWRFDGCLLGIPFGMYGFRCAEGLSPHFHDHFFDYFLLIADRLEVFLLLKSVSMLVKTFNILYGG